MDQHRIQDWQQKLLSEFKDSQFLLDYLKTTMESFFYRYLETSISKDLKLTLLSEKKWGAMAFEDNMVNALKITHPEIKKGIMELARANAKSKGTQVKYSLWIELVDFSSDRGKVHLVSEIDWGYPQFDDTEKRMQKKLTWQYDSLGQFRKELAIKLEEVCSLFL